MYTRCTIYMYMYVLYTCMYLVHVGSVINGIINFVVSTTQECGGIIKSFTMWLYEFINLLLFIILLFVVILWFCFI